MLFSLKSSSLSPTIFSWISHWTHFFFWILWCYNYFYSFLVRSLFYFALMLGTLFVLSFVICLNPHLSHLFTSTLVLSAPFLNICTLYGIQPLNLSHTLESVQLFALKWVSSSVPLLFQISPSLILSLSLDQYYCFCSKLINLFEFIYHFFYYPSFLTESFCPP